MDKAVNEEIFEKAKADNGNGGCWKRFITSIIGSPSSETDGDDESSRLAQPADMAGWVEKKGSKNFGLEGGWQKRHMAVTAPGILQYWKDGDTSRDPHGEVDLRLVVSFSVPAPKKGEAPRLDLVFSDKTFKVRFLTEDDASYWTSGLSSWRDYAVDSANNPGASDNDIGDEESFRGSAGVSNNPQSDDDYDKIFKSLAIPGDAVGGSGVGDSSDAPPQVGASVLSFFRGGGKKAQNQNSNQEVSKSKGSAAKEEDEEEYEEEAPDALEGWLEKKSHNAFGNNYQKRYFRINESSGCLEYAKSLKEVETNPNSIDLNQIVDVTQDNVRQSAEFF